MSIEYFVLKTWRFLSLGFAILFLFLKYYAMPDMVAVFFNNLSKPEGFLPKNQFYYLFTSLLLAINLLPAFLLFIGKNNLNPILIGLPISFSKKFDNNSFKIWFENCINLTISVLNTILIIAILILAKLNSSEYLVKIGDYNWFLYVLIFGLISIIVYPIFRTIFIKSNNVFVS